MKQRKSAGPTIARRVGKEGSLVGTVGLRQTLPMGMKPTSNLSTDGGSAHFSLSSGRGRSTYMHT